MKSYLTSNSFNAGAIFRVFCRLTMIYIAIAVVGVVDGFQNLKKSLF